jgi:hypothetical protein
MKLRSFLDESSLAVSRLHEYAFSVFWAPGIFLGLRDQAFGRSLLAVDAEHQRLASSVIFCKGVGAAHFQRCNSMIKDKRARPRGRGESAGIQKPFQPKTVLSITIR